MSAPRPTRNHSLTLWGSFALAVTLSFVAGAQPDHLPAPIERRTQPATGQPAAGQPSAPTPGNTITPGRPNQNLQHLPQWMDAHRGMSFVQQQQALSNEPGFRQLKPQEQQRLINHLQQLNSMPPQQQQRVIARNEVMESLPPAQRQQIRGAMAQLGDLPEERRHAVGRTFQTLRTMPQPQQQAYLNSMQFRSQFNDQERATVVRLLNVAPIAAGLPGFGPRPGQPPPPYGPPQ